MENWIPKIIPINREIDYHTHFIGTTKDNKQFFGYETFAFPDGIPETDWEDKRQEYVVLYIFDQDGNHIETRSFRVGNTKSTNGEQIRKKLLEMIEQLGPIEYENIAVKPFTSVIDGIEFGLIPDNEYESIELQPSSTIAFFEPWNGDYDT